MTTSIISRKRSIWGKLSRKTREKSQDIKVLVDDAVRLKEAALIISEIMGLIFRNSSNPFNRQSTSNAFGSRSNNPFERRNTSNDTASRSPFARSGYASRSPMRRSTTGFHGSSNSGNNPFSNRSGGSKSNPFTGGGSRQGNPFTRSSTTRGPFSGSQTASKSNVWRSGTTVSNLSKTNPFGSSTTKNPFSSSGTSKNVFSSSSGTNMFGKSGSGETEFLKFYEAISKDPYGIEGSKDNKTVLNRSLASGFIGNLYVLLSKFIATISLVKI